MVSKLTEKIKSVLQGLVGNYFGEIESQFSFNKPDLDRTKNIGDTTKLSCSGLRVNFS